MARYSRAAICSRVTGSFGANVTALVPLTMPLAAAPGNGAGVILPGGDIRERRFSIVVRFCLGIARQDRYEHGAG